MTDINKLEGQLSRLQADRTARRARLEAIDPEGDGIRAQLKRARGEAALGDQVAKKAIADFSARLAALDEERDTAEAALEILDERISAAAAALSEAKADEKEMIATACRRAEEEAFEAFSIAFRGVVGPLQRMAAARHIAAAHGIAITDRGRTIRDRLRAAGHNSERSEGRRQRKVVIPAAQGIPTEIMSGTDAFFPGYISAVEDLIHHLQRDGVPIQGVAPPELERPVGVQPPFPTPALIIRPASPSPETIHIGRARAPELGDDGVPVEQSAQPPAGYRGEERQIAGFTSGRPARTADPTEVERVSVFRR
ncbi:hypothetical protein G3545_04560 [Starkeya sp. ORNL1]|uniref:hypothetical protein n=1 Tax=Starkeya sp. ORNL1 TaxID=2709380 RepID=UPI001463B9E9|nr:hypothetical protein [Starkeya sp. ORNL1]QJP12991.1 hypothetical protein G3545_04560 [Starkeya sp. ORNL1]